MDGDFLRAVFLLAVLAGCITDSPAGTADNELPEADPLPQDVQLLGCIEARSQVLVPGWMVSGTTPPGWEGEWNLVGLYYDFLSCDHLSLAGFERGPIRLVMEFHSDFNVPETCLPGDYTLLGVLERLWTDDPEVNAYLRSRLGMRAEDASIDVGRDRATDPSVLTWTWGREGDVPSSVNFGRVGGPMNEGTTVQRLVWQAGAGVAMLDVRLGGLQTMYEPMVNPGKLYAPTLYSQTGFTDFPGDGGDVDAGAPVGTFHYFADPLCQDPIHP